MYCSVEYYHEPATISIIKLHHSKLLINKDRISEHHGYSSINSLSGGSVRLLQSRKCLEIACYKYE